MRPRRALLPLVLAGLACLPAAGCTAVTGSAPARARVATARPAPTAPVVMFLGDSYTVGERGALPENTYAAGTARLLGWQVVLGGRAGTGFVSPGTTRPRQDFGQMFESQLGWRPAPDLLVVAGGHNDVHAALPAVLANAREVLERAKQRWPGTRRLLIGPMWGDGHPPATALAVRDGLKRLAAAEGVPFVDPLAEKWITGDRSLGTGNAPGYIKPDRTHPTNAGHRYLASRLAADLRRLNLARPSRTP
ncbi:SGNH/GDSL hydrolase family protein [Actinomadura parmotrematis]|uniref:SGNH/GDSL hydrolase family protein n=1 Tax=Actinomadura parmotrematis TaxID=2864039 RepID=A0ABS7FVF5_9ACTN|nr:SGNH/GDSL hydrolase family protein [Actinomadura parmotrematis]MBW8484397.1 SGNH/GDSL hydrolase family protein [Actinomadura parmotrematis]